MQRDGPDRRLFMVTDHVEWEMQMTYLKGLILYFRTVVEDAKCSEPSARSIVSTPDFYEGF